MTRRIRIGLLALVVGGLMAGASAVAFGHMGRHGIMKRMV